MASNKKKQPVDKAQENRDSLSDELISLRFLAKVSKLMEDKNITKKELASKLETSPSYVTQLFQGDKLVNVRLLTKLKRALNLTIEITCQPVLPKVTSQQLALEGRPSLSISIGLSSNLGDFSIVEESGEVSEVKDEAVFQLTLSDSGTWIYPSKS